MARETHTPGPWTVSEVRSGDGTTWCRVDLGTLQPQPGLAGPHRAHARAELTGATNKANRETQRANARLIAAAPELLAALQWALDYGTFEVAMDNPTHAAALDHARAALALGEEKPS